MSQLTKAPFVHSLVSRHNQKNTRREVAHSRGWKLRGLNFCPKKYKDFNLIKKKNNGELFNFEYLFYITVKCISIFFRVKQNFCGFKLLVDISHSYECNP